MAKKIGQVLVESALITVDQLETALAHQLIHGGHLGTCLVELGYLDVERLGQTLAESLGISCVDSEVLRGVRRPVLGCLSGALAEKHLAIPLCLLDNLLHVAMVNPKDLDAQAEIAFASGHKIQPWVVPEILFYQALEEHYCIPRRPRFLALDHREEKETPPEKGDLSHEGLSSESEGKPTVALDPGIATPDQEPLQEPTWDPGGEYGYGHHWEDIAEGIHSNQPEAVDEIPSHHLEELEENLACDLEGVSDRLCHAGNGEELIAAALDYASRTCPRCIFFSVRGTLARPWDWRGMSIPPDKIASLGVPVTAEPVFMLPRGEDHYRGSVPDDPAYLTLYRELGLQVPREILVFPVHLDDRLITIFYGDSGARDRITGRTEDYHRLMRKLVLALKMLVIQRKIRAA
jgi:hypothetical protein